MLGISEVKLKVSVMNPQTFGLGSSLKCVSVSQLSPLEQKWGGEGGGGL